MVIHVREQADPDGFVTPTDLRRVELTVPARTSDWFCVPVHHTTKLRYFWLWVEKCAGVYWNTWKVPPLDYARSERDNESERFENIREEAHCVLLQAPDVQVADCSPAQIINGYGRIQDARHYEWVSEKGAPLPQWIELDLRERAAVNAVYITFDTDMTNPAHENPIHPLPLTMVRDYTVEVFDGEKWKEVASETDNIRRRRIHRFASICADKVRITVTRTVDGIAARIFEVRLYNE